MDHTRAGCNRNGPWVGDETWRARPGRMRRVRSRADHSLQRLEALSTWQASSTSVENPCLRRSELLCRDHHTSAHPHRTMRCRPHRREGRRLGIRHGHRGRGRSQGSSQRDRASRASRASRGAAGRNGRLGEAGLRLHIFGALRWAASVHQSNPALPGA